MGNTPTKGGFIKFTELNQEAQNIIDEFDIPIKSSTPVKNISVAYQQMVEIMKAYARRADIYCFDEPTAPLTEKEIKSLFKIIKKLKAENKCIVYVSHRINEIFELSDRVVVRKMENLLMW
jgi:ABC-type sugar transport system ATPase subunit